jgi:hypothetical protein
MVASIWANTSALLLRRGEANHGNDLVRVPARIGMMLAVGVVALAPLLIRLAFFGCIALVIAIVAGVVIWSLWANPGHALALALTFGWIPPRAGLFRLRSFHGLAAE